MNQETSISSPSSPEAPLDLQFEFEKLKFEMQYYMKKLNPPFVAEVGSFLMSWKKFNEFHSGSNDL